MQVTGKIIVLNDTEIVKDNFKKRLVVIETEEQYKQKIPVDFVQDKTDLLNSFSIGQEVEISVNVRGNEYNGKFYVNLQGWKIKALSEATLAPVESDEPQDMPF